MTRNNDRGGCYERRGFDAETAFRALARDMAHLVDSAAPTPLHAAAAPAVQAPNEDPPWISILKQSRSRLAKPAEILGGRPTRDFASCCCIGDDADGYYGSGVLIHPRVVLTAAHCGTRIRRVFVGGWDIRQTNYGELMWATEVVPCPDYNVAVGVHDLSLIFLAAPAKTAPAALASTSELTKMDRCELVGFGYADPNRPLGLGTKRAASVPIAALQKQPNDNWTAAEQQLGFDAAFEFAAGRKYLGIDSCKSDSGGPAYLLTDDGPKVAGITARSTREAVTACGDGGIYSRIDRHLDWVRATCAAKGVALP